MTISSHLTLDQYLHRREISRNFSRCPLVDLKDYPAALEPARDLYRAAGHLRQSVECREIGDVIGMSSIGIWHACQRGDLGVPAPNAERAKAWAKGERFYVAEDRPCRRCGGVRRQPGDDMCFDCERARRAATKVKTGPVAET